MSVPIGSDVTVSQTSGVKDVCPLIELDDLSPRASSLQLLFVYRVRLYSTRYLPGHRSIRISWAISVRMPGDLLMQALRWLSIDQSTSCAAFDLRNGSGMFFSPLVPTINFSHSPSSLLMLLRRGLFEKCSEWCGTSEFTLESGFRCL